MSKKPVIEKENHDQTIPTTKLRKALYLSVFAIIVAGAGYFSWKNYDIIKEKFFPSQEITADKDFPPAVDLFSLVEEKADKATTYALQEKILNLQALLNELTLKQSNSADIANLNERIDNMQDLLIASVNGKADAQSVIGLMVRLDKIENELDRLSRLNNEGAIMLAATMLVKENALEGKNFAFEAAMLAELAGRNPKISGPLKVIENAAQTGIATNTEIALEFNDIYDSLQTKEPEIQTEENWKDRLNNKLSELITINKAEEKAKEVEHNRFLEAIKDLSEKQQFAQIAVLLKESDLTKTPALQKWIRTVEKKQIFESAISQISSYCLVLMKVNNLLVKD